MYSEFIERFRVASGRVVDHLFFELVDEAGAEEAEEDAEEKREDNFERSYNFRFEEAGATQLVGHARCSLAGVELALGAPHRGPVVRTRGGRRSNDAQAHGARRGRRGGGLICTRP